MCVGIYTYAHPSCNLSTFFGRQGDRNGTAARREIERPFSVFSVKHTKIERPKGASFFGLRHRHWYIYQCLVLKSSCRVEKQNSENNVPDCQCGMRVGIYTYAHSTLAIGYCLAQTHVLGGCDFPKGLGGNKKVRGPRSQEQAAGALSPRWRKRVRAS